ncbi:MAG: tRNA (adenosine(37)-N6)-threonylcarbamoyltransferase complex dimerization subunit type 1 TsaB [Candidatus Dormibacteria bacterium]|jgi:tRNA threonylcarbamoyladenosine biosynthesis protein TsaB
MTVLAIDTASRHRLVVLRAGLAGELVAARTASGGAALPWLDRCLVELGLSDLGAVVVVTGPGSYTGLRSGIAIGLGVAHTLGLPLHGVSSLEVAARSAPDGENETLALVEAGRDGAYAGRFHRREGILEMHGEARRVSLASVAVGEPPPVTLDALDLPGVLPGDPVRALAAAIPAALARPPLALAGLAATYLD